MSCSHIPPPDQLLQLPQLLNHLHSMPTCSAWWVASCRMLQAINRSSSNAPTGAMACSPHLWIHEGGCIPRHAPAPAAAAAAPSLLLLPPAAVVQGQHVFNRVEQLGGSGREVVDLPCLQLRACSSGNSRGEPQPAGQPGSRSCRSLDGQPG
jgi:hypothetical protein